MSNNPNYGNENDSYNPDEGNYEVSDFTTFNPDAYISKRGKPQSPSQPPPQPPPQPSSQPQSRSQPPPQSYSQPRPQPYPGDPDAAVVNPDEAAPLEGFDTPAPEDQPGYGAPKYSHLKGTVPAISYNPLMHTTPLMRIGIIMYGCAMIVLAVTMCLCNITLGFWMLQR